MGLTGRPGNMGERVRDMNKDIQSICSLLTVHFILNRHSMMALIVLTCQGRPWCERSLWSTREDWTIGKYCLSEITVLLLFYIYWRNITVLYLGHVSVSYRGGWDLLGREGPLDLR